MIFINGVADCLSKWNKWRRGHSHRYNVFCGELDDEAINQTIYLQVLVDVESREMLEISSAAENVSNVQKKRKKVRTTHTHTEISLMSQSMLLSTSWYI